MSPSRTAAKEKDDQNNYISQRAKARWKILKSAIQSNKIISQNDLMFSIHRFAGFQLLTRRKALISENECLSTNHLGFRCCNEQLKFIIDDPNYEIIDYSTPLPEYLKEILKTDNIGPTMTLPVDIRLRTRERKTMINGMYTNVDLSELISHAHNNGIDNTGNLRVWDSSSTLAYLLLHGSYTSKMTRSIFSSSPVAYERIVSNPMNGPDVDISRPYLLQSNIQSLNGLEMSTSGPFIGLAKILSLATGDELKTLRVIELGGGMVALPSLLLGVVGRLITKHTMNRISIDVTITDGHKRCILNNMISAALTNPIDSALVAEYLESNDYTRPCNLPNLRIQHLLWKADDHGCNCRGIMKDDPLYHKKEFDLCLVSDCIHFVEYHAALLVTIGRLLRVNGTCILCQPARGHSLRLFMSLIQALNGCNPLFEMHLHDNYDDYIYSKHLAMLNDKESHLYDPSIHYPYLLTLKKLRLFSEEIDTPAARCEAERISSAH